MFFLTPNKNMFVGKFFKWKRFSAVFSTGWERFKKVVYFINLNSVDIENKMIIFNINWVEVDKINYFFKSSKGRSRKSFVKISHENIHKSRGVFRTQSNIYGGAFCGSIERLLAVNYFQKSSIIDVHPGSKSNSGICPTLISKNYEPLSIISLRNISSSSYWDSLQ